MKRYVLSIVLMTMFVSTAVFSQEPEVEEDIERQMHLRSMQLELEEREGELGFQERMRELELEQRRIELERQRRAQEHPGHRRHHRNGGILPFVLVCFVVHILVAVWVYKDIRERNRGSGIWIVIALLTGLFGVLAYAIVRLGDTRQTKS
ncbi:hypothetical protein ES703_85475 [subsurface metagenome]